MKRLILLLLIILALLVPTTAEASTYPMPYCPCIDLDYYPQGPELPMNPDGVMFDRYYEEVTGVVSQACVDVGDVPFSVPGFGWHCKITEEGLSVKMTVQSIGPAVAVKLANLGCCAAVVTPDDPVYLDAVILEWNSAAGAYIGTVGGMKYVLEVQVEGNWTYLKFYEGRFSPTTGAVNLFVSYIAGLPPLPVRNPLDNEAEVK